MAPNTSRVNSFTSFPIEEVATDKESLFDTKTTTYLSNQVAVKSNQDSNVSALQEFTKLFEQTELSNTVERLENSKFDNGDYWGWHSDDTPVQVKTKLHKALLYDIEEKNKIRDMLSIDEIEKSLVLNVKNENNIGITDNSTNTTKNDEYWANQSDQDICIWLTSIHCIEEGLVAESKKRNQSESNEHLGYNSYWDWRNGQSTFERERRRIEEVRNNLRIEDQNRDLFSMNTIERFLNDRKNKMYRIQDKNVDISTMNDNSDYWDW